VEFQEQRAGSLLEAREGEEAAAARQWAAAAMAHFDGNIDRAEEGGGAAGRAALAGRPLLGGEQIEARHAGARHGAQWQEGLEDAFGLALAAQEGGQRVNDQQINAMLLVQGLNAVDERLPFSGLCNEIAENGKLVKMGSYLSLLICRFLEFRCK